MPTLVYQSLFEVPRPLVKQETRGWSVVEPDMPQFRREQALPEWAGRLDFVAFVPPPAFPYGWTVEPPLLTEASRATAPAAMAAAGPALPPEPVRGTYYGWTDEPPLLNYVQRFTTPAEIFAGPSLPAEPVVPTDYGWTVEPPLLFAYAQRTAMSGAFAGLSLSLAQIVPGPGPLVLPLGAISELAISDPPMSLLPPTGWSVEPALVFYGPLLTSRAAVFAGQFAGRLDFLSTAVATAQWGWQGEDSTRQVRPPAAPAAMAAAGPSLPPEAVADLLETGWTVEPPLLAWPYRAAVGGVTVAAGSSLPPEQVDPFSYGWSVDVPDLPQFIRRQALPEWTSRLDFTADVVVSTILWGWHVDPPIARVPARALVAEEAMPPPPITAAFAYGWAIDLPDVPRAVRRWSLPEWSGRLDPAATEATSFRWSVEPPLLVLPARATGPAVTFAGPYLPAESVAPARYGSSVAIPDLPAFRRHQAFPELALRLDPAAPASPVGWSVEPPPLLWPPRADLGQIISDSGVFLPPEPVQRPQYGSSVALPDLPAFRRYQALPELSLRVDRPTPALSSVWGGWVVELPITRLPAFASAGQFAGASLAPEPITRPSYGWSVEPPYLTQPVRRTGPAEVFAEPVPEPEPVVLPQYGSNVALPDLPTFRRYQALPDSSLRLDPAPTVLSAVFGGWVVEVPITRQPRFSNAAQAAGPFLMSTPVNQPSYGWTDEPPLVIQIVRRTLPAELFAGPFLEPEPITAAFPYGWTDEPPLLSWPARPSSGGVVAASGPFLPPEPVVLVQYGSNVALPDLPAFRRYQALPDLSLPPETIGISPPGWPTQIPDLPAFRRYQALPEWSGRIDFVPFTGFTFLWGWQNETPTVLIRPSAASDTFAAGISLPPEPVAAAYPYGWSVTALELPRFVRREALPEWSGRLDFRADVSPTVWGWFVEPPIARALRPFQMLPDTSLPYVPVESFSFGWSVTPFDSPHFARPQPFPEWAGPLDLVAPFEPMISWGWCNDQLVARTSPRAILPEPPLASLITTAFPYGWSVEPPLLTQAVRQTVPAELFAGPFLEPEPVTAAYPYGWSVEPPALSWPPVRASGGVVLASGAWLLPQAVALSPVGSNVALPDFPALRRYQALPDFFGRLDSSRDEVSYVYGWPAIVPDLPRFARQQALGEWSGRLDLILPVLPTVWGWQEDQPAARRAPSALLDGPRFPHVTVTATYPYGWTDEPPLASWPSRRTAPGAMFAGNFVIPETFAWVVTPRFVRIAPWDDYTALEVPPDAVVARAPLFRYVGEASDDAVVARVVAIRYVAVLPREEDDEMPQIQELPPIAPAQQQTIAVDFGVFLPVGVTLVGSPTLNLTVQSGVDPQPQSRLASGPTVGTVPTSQGGSGVPNVAVLFRIAGALGGVTYVVEAVCARSDGDVAEGWTLLPCVKPGA